MNSIANRIQLGVDKVRKSRSCLEKLSLVLILVFSFCFPPFLFAQETTEGHEDLSVEQWLNKMSLEEKVSQVFIFGFAGTEYAKGLGPRLRSLRPGGTIIFQRNIKSPGSLSQMISQAQKETLIREGLPLFTMMDQEGGTVTRIKTRPNSPSALSMGNTNNPKLVQNIGFITGRILDLLGINVNLAPVMDLSDPARKTFIGNRSFGNSPQHVSTMTQAFSKGLTLAGVIPAAKHFPGHGGLHADSHKGTTVKYESLKEIKTKDLIPFQNFIINNQLSAIMVAHVSYPELDDSHLPATYSKKIVTDLLRDQMGYNGLIITDDLEMLG
ncbi:MAG: glycoside hydrolase family 3 protein, partial [Bdellovibrionales bacterium]|nr:glycoside hydrolase family 3 protein [Bdellovibrionales bacterium]